MKMQTTSDTKSKIPNLQKLLGPDHLLINIIRSNGEALTAHNIVLIAAKQLKLPASVLQVPIMELLTKGTRSGYLQVRNGRYFEEIPIDKPKFRSKVIEEKELMERLQKEARKRITEMKVKKKSSKKKR